MGQGSKNCKRPSHQLLKDKAKKWVDDLQLMHNELQLARKESRAGDVAILEEQVNQILREWKAELHEPTPASSLLEDSPGSFSAELGRLLQQYDEEDDATSPLSEPPATRQGNVSHAYAMANSTGATSPLSEPPAMRQGNVSHAYATADSTGDKEVYYVNHTPQQHGFQGFENHMQQQYEFQSFEHCNGAASSLHGTIDNKFEASSLHNLGANNFEMGNQLDYLHLDAHQNFDNEIFFSPSRIEQWGVDGISDFSGLMPNPNPPPSAFLGPKCALWDCARPAQVSEFCKNYCSSFHADLAVKECPPGARPVLRPGGIDLKDGPLLVTLKAKIEGKDVGIPECEGAATAKSPWKAPELFDISILQGEKIREWLFFDKPRRAFETGTRKQRSLPDHEGRGWHESRKLIMKEYGGLKRSYYADPQPQCPENFEWHLFEYEIADCDVCALYRLEVKVAEEKKKSPKPKGTNDLLVDLQKRMGRLTAEVTTEKKRSGKSKAKANLKSDHGNAVLASNSSSEINVHGSGGLPAMQCADGTKDC